MTDLDELTGTPTPTPLHRGPGREDMRPQSGALATAGALATEGALATAGARRGWTLHDEVGADMVGEVLDGRFEVVERIGRGGMGWVFRCDDLALHGQAAVKVLMSQSEEARRRFADEARLLANVRHPGLVRVLATGTTEEGAPYLAMEFLGGPSLQDRLKAGGPLPWREVVEIGVQVAEALAGLHSAGVIHRDIKPANIVLLEATAARPLVKVIDLGIAKVLDWSAVGPEVTSRWKARMTAIGEVVGTHGYCAPEAGRVAVDARFDVYSLGVTLYQLCTGEKPAPGELQAIRGRCPGGEVPAELEAVIAAAVAIDPDERIGSAAELAARLRAIASACEGAEERRVFAGCFEVLEALGTGAKAQVFRAYDRIAGRYVALKVLGERTREDAEERRRFALEARVLGAVRHPALPRLYSGQMEARPYLAMSLAKGRPASDFCLAGSTLAPAEVIAVGQAIAGALAELHARGVIHRDVNASNIVVERGAPTRAVLVDLGMCELTPRFYEVAEPRYLTPPESRLPLGTGGLERLEWTAPEARGGAGWTGKSDVFSLGLALYKMLTGKRPFVGGAAAARPIREVMPRCPAPLAAAIAWALEVDPDDRCDAQRLEEALEEAGAELAAIEGEGARATEAPRGEAPRVSPSVAAPRVEAPRAGPSVEAGRAAGSRAAGEAALAEGSWGAGWQWWTLLGSLVLGLLYMGFLIGVACDAYPRRSAQGQDQVVRAPPKEPPARVEGLAGRDECGVIRWPPRVGQVEAASERPAPAEAATLDEAVSAARPRWIACAAETEGLLTLVLSTRAGEGSIAKVEALGHEDDPIGRCVAEVAAELRFAPTPRAMTMTTTMELTP